MPDYDGRPVTIGCMCWQCEDETRAHYAALDAARDAEAAQKATRDLEHIPTALYRHWSGSSLLYVGITTSLVKRRAQHRRKSAWFPQVDRVELVQWFKTRSEAVEAERSMIHDLRPPYNKTHNPLARQYEAV